jgi:hypothetical protein
MTVAELAEHNVVLQGVDYGKETQQLLPAHKMSVRSSARAIDDAAIIAIVESGLGVSVMPELAMISFRSSVQTYPFYPAESRSIALASLGHEALAPAGKAMHKHIVDSVAAWVRDRGHHISEAGCSAGTARTRLVDLRPDVRPVRVLRVCLGRKALEPIRCILNRMYRSTRC